MIDININASDFDKAIEDINEEIDDASAGTVQDVANRGKQTAFSNAPDESGDL